MVKQKILNDHGESKMKRCHVIWELIGKPCLKDQNENGERDKNE